MEQEIPPATVITVDGRRRKKKNFPRAEEDGVRPRKAFICDDGGGDDVVDNNYSSYAPTSSRLTAAVVNSGASTSVTKKAHKNSSSNHRRRHATINRVHGHDSSFHDGFLGSSVASASNSSFDVPSAVFNRHAAQVLPQSSSNRYSPSNVCASYLSSSSYQCCPSQIDNKENYHYAPPPSLKNTSKKNENPQRHKKHRRTASLTDLRPEDKKKVADLIQELASLGSEKEKIEICLKTERNNFEEAIRDLVSDQKTLLSERQSVQAELHACQQMLMQLQEAVLQRHTSSVLSSQSSVNKDNDFGIMWDNRPRDASHCSELDHYISKHSITQDMDAVSECRSVTIDSIKNPRTSSTFVVDANAQFRIPGSSSSHEVASQSNDSFQPVNSSTIDHSKKEEILAEHSRLLREQRLLRQRLVEQESLLRDTQQRLYLRENQLTDRQMTTNQTTYAEVSGPCIDTRVANSFSVGVQVNSSVEKTPPKHTDNHSVQTDLPMVVERADEHPRVEERMYIGNRLVPSPGNCTSRSENSMQQAIEKSNRLLESAKKVIEEAESPRSSTRRYSCHTYSPRKSSQQLFDSADRSLATELNSTTADDSGADNPTFDRDADRTELHLLEDIFYVRSTLAP